jgi:predicted DsbA family dithiol-disulfide isomerase
VKTNTPVPEIGDRPHMTTTLKIDFVSDVSCPWCAIGLQSLETALSRLQGDVEVQMQFQPFELNPQMVPEGEDITEHLSKKYGSTPEQAAAARENIRARGEVLGFTFNMDKRARIYNTFDAHRLLHWAEDTGLQTALKKALFKAYFTDGKDPSQHAVLIEAAESVYLNAGIHSVPAVVINDRHLISGGQPPEVFEQALRQIAAE